jgi:RNA polymerase sigma-70 factor (ECF subfamily)
MQRPLNRFGIRQKRGASQYFDGFARNPNVHMLSGTDVAEIPEITAEQEQELLRRAQAGDEDAFGVLVRGQYEPTFRMICSMIRDEHAARDVCQEVWVAVWRNLGRFRGDSKFSTWVHPIAVRKAIDHLRSRRRRLSRFIPFLSGDEAADHPGLSHAAEPATEETPRDEAEKEERKRQFEEAIDSLPPKHRAVLALREVQGLSYDEIADALSIRRGTVMSRLFNARRMLAQKLGHLP